MEKTKPTTRLICQTLAWVALVVTAQADEPAAPENTNSLNRKGIVQVKPAEKPYVQIEAGYMIPYEETIPGTDAKIKMLPIPGGEFMLGSPADEEGRSDDEGPQVKVRVPPFWMSETEVTWGQYMPYMNSYEGMKALDELRMFALYKWDDAEKQQKQRQLVAQIDRFSALSRIIRQETDFTTAVTSPTPLYEPSFTFELGDEDNQPAVTMTQFAAKQYTKWLSGILASDYRLPSEVEWEYAARAGSRDAFSFGNDFDRLDDYAWSFFNSEDQMKEVGTLKPNPWGLYDMHGNVAEWVLDQYVEDHYGKLAKEGKVIDAADAIAWPSKEHPRVLRGGSWGDDPERVRSAARMQSNWEWTEGERNWKEQDPNLPKSPWWFTEPETRQIGFRILRPVKPMDAKMKKRVWEPDAPLVRLNVEGRLQEGRGVLGIPDPEVGAALEALKDEDLKKARNNQ